MYKDYIENLHRLHNLVVDEVALHGRDLLDQQGPQGLAKDSVNRLVSLGEAFEGVRVQGEEHYLQ